VLEDETDRRTLLRAGATLATVGVAGCSRLNTITGDPNTQDDDDGTDLREIRFGETRTGRIDKDDGTDPLYDDLAEPVSFDGEADQRVEITMASDAFDPYLVLTDGDGNVVSEDDDGADETDSSLQATLEADGTYTIWAGSFSGDAVGAYTLSLEEGTAPETTDLREIDFGQTRQGTIDSADPRDPAHNDLAEPVTFQASADQTAVIAMESEQIDPYLVLGDGDGNVLTQNDDGGSGFNSRMEPVIPEDGTYTIWAGSFEPDATGDYTLSLEEGTAPETTNLHEIDFGQTREGYIDSEDSRAPASDKLGEPVTFEGAVDQTAAITMDSEAIDPYLVLTDDTGTVIAENDDGGSGFNSRITTSLPEDGTYTIWATSFGGDGTGRYTLSLEEGSDTVADGADLREIDFGQTRDSYVDADDGRDPQYNDIAEPVAFEASSGTTVRITMTSDEIDPFLVLTTENDTVVAENDDGGTGFNSQIETTLQQDATYVIWAGSFSGEATGAYTLSLERV
jgi:hypothetical protein